MVTLSGQRIVRFYTLNYRYALGKIGVELDDGTHLRVDVSELAKLVNGVTFGVTKKVKHSYLTVDHYEGISEVV